MCTCTAVKIAIFSVANSYDVFGINGIGNPWHLGAYLETLSISASTPDCLGTHLHIVSIFLLFVHLFVNYAWMYQNQKLSTDNDLLMVIFLLYTSIILLFENERS